jgi:hypothetical protein
VRKSEQINELAAALSKAQAKVQGAHKTSDNPFFKSKYADLAAVWDACREPLTENGLSVLQFPVTEIVPFKGVDDKGNEFDGTYAKVTCITLLLHSSGQWIEDDSFTAEAKDAGPQAIGSAVTYLRRYSLQAVAGVAPEDDDGNAASPQVQRERPQAVQTPMRTGKPEPSVTPEYAAFEGYLKATVNSHPDDFATVADAWTAIKPECERQGLTTAAALKGCRDLNKFAALKAAVEDRISVPI